MRLISDRPRSALRQGAREVRFVVSLRALPPRVAWFQWRARDAAQGEGDEFSLASATRPRDLAILLSLSRDRERVAELGTATGWTALSLALASPRRRVWSYDPTGRAEVDRYRRLVRPGARSRVEFITEPGSVGPPAGVTVDLLYVDSSHDRDDTIAEVKAWAPALRPGALIVFDDYAHPDFPGVRAAVEALGLSGRQRGTLFVHEVRS